MKNKQGISLIVLVITIIVMIILAAAVVITLSNTGVINKATHAVSLTDEKQAQDLASLIWADAYLDQTRTDTIEKVVKDKLKVQGITEDNWNINVTDDGVRVSKKENSNDSGGNNSVKRTFGVMMDESKYVYGEICHIEDAAWYNAENPLKPFNDAMIEFEYEENMTWREWVNSPYNTQNFVIVVARNAEGGLAGECIATNGSVADEGEQITIAYLDVYYSDAACTKMVTDENNIAGCGKVYYGIRELFNLDEKIDTTLNRLQPTVSEFMGKYYKSTPFLSFGLYEW